MRGCKNLGGRRNMYFVMGGNRSLGGTPSQAPVGLSPPMFLSLRPPTPMILLLPLVPWSLPRASQAPTPYRFLHRPRLLHRVIILPFPCPRSAVPSHASAPSGPLTSTLMSPLPGYQEIEYQLQNRCSILEPIVNFGKVLKLIIGI